MKRVLAAAGVAVMGMLFVNAANAEETMTATELMNIWKLGGTTLLLDDLVICTNEEDNDEARKDANWIAERGITVPAEGKNLPDGTKCGFAQSQGMKATMTGVMMEPGGRGGPTVVEIKSKTKGIAYVILRPRGAKRIAQL